MHVHVLIWAIFNVQRGITLKVGKPELWFMCSLSCPIALYICVKIRENIEWTQVYSVEMAIFNIYHIQRATTPKVG